MLHMLDFFYFEEHLVIVSELLGNNLYEFAKAVKEAGHPEYFTLPRLCKIARQCLEVRRATCTVVRVSIFAKLGVAEGGERGERGRLAYRAADNCAPNPKGVISL